MKKIIVLTIILSFFACADKKSDITVSKFLTDTEVQRLKSDVVRYIEDLPRLATHKNKFDTIFNKEYAKKALKLKVMFAYKSDKTDTLYFAVSKIAPSLIQKRVAVGLKMVYDESRKITFYQEKFRTWKMTDTKLEEITATIFQDFIQQKDLSKYYTKNSNGKFLIEFPDDKNFYDTKTRTWQFKGDQRLLAK